MMNRNKLKFFLSVIFLITGIFNVSAASVTLDFPSKISEGQLFDVKVIIDPEGGHVAGAQLDLEFDRSSIFINSITEGNLLKQSGINTFFNSGTIDNSQGKVENIYGTILGPKNVTTSGTFIIINARAIVSTNTPKMNLTKVSVVDPQGMQYPISSQKSVNQKANIDMVSSSGDGAPGGGSGGATGEESQEQGGSNNTIFIMAFAGIIIISILIYKYVIPKYSA
jgi:Cohesin domain